MITALMWLLVGYFILRSCVLNPRNSLPPDLTEQIEKQHIACISPDDTPIWPGETRQPECGTVEIKLMGEGIIPENQKTDGITRAICYQIKEENPLWSTLGTTRHEIKWSARTAYQVAILQNGSWKIFPDQEQENAKRWTAYSCPNP